MRTKVFVLFAIISIGLAACQPQAQECSSGDILTKTSGEKLVCSNGQWIPETLEAEGKNEASSEYPVQIKITELSWKCTVKYSAGWLKGGYGTAEVGGLKGKQMRCPEPPGPYPVKGTGWFFFYQFKNLNTGEIGENLPYLQESEWRKIEKGKYMCRKNWQTYVWEKACIPFNLK